MIFKIFYNVKDIFTKSNMRFGQFFYYTLIFCLTCASDISKNPGSNWPDPGSEWPIRVQIARIQVQSDQIQVHIDGFGFRLTGSWFRLPGSWFRLTRSRFRLTESGFRLTGSRFRLTESRFRLIGSRFTRSRFRLTGSGFRLTFLSLLLSVETDFTDSREIFFRLNPDSYSIFKKNWSGSEPFQKPDSNSAVLWT